MAVPDDDIAVVPLEIDALPVGVRSEPLLIGELRIDDLVAIDDAEEEAASSLRSRFLTAVEGFAVLHGAAFDTDDRIASVMAILRLTIGHIDIRSARDGKQMHGALRGAGDDFDIAVVFRIEPDADIGHVGRMDVPHHDIAVRPAVIDTHDEAVSRAVGDLQILDYEMIRIVNRQNAAPGGRRRRRQTRFRPVAVRRDDDRLFGRSRELGIDHRHAVPGIARFEQDAVARFECSPIDPVQGFPGSIGRGPRIRIRPA